MKFIIKGYADASYAQHPETRKGTSGNATTLNEAPVISKSIMQTTVKLSVTEAKLDSVTTEVQDDSSTPMIATTRDNSTAAATPIQAPGLDSGQKVTRRQSMLQTLQTLRLYAATHQPP